MGRGWEHTIDTQRDEVDLLLRQAPSLRNCALETLPEIYPKSVRDAAKETKLPRASFPKLAR